MYTMKKITVLLIIVLTVLGCSQQQDCSNGQLDSGETGIDCGGNCPPCPATNPPAPTNSIIQDIQGLWYNNLTVTETGIPVKDQQHGININLDNSCKVDFTTNNPITINNLIYYDLYGYYGGCGYPFQGAWYYNPNNNTINNSHSVTIDNDTMKLNNVPDNGSTYVSHRYPLTATNSNLITFDLELSNSYPDNNEVKIVFVGGGVNDSIPILTNQTSYSISKTINLTTPWLLIYLSSDGSTSGAPITINYKVKVNNEVVAISSPQTFCTYILNSSTGQNCSGFPILLGNRLLTQINWSL